MVKRFILQLLLVVIWVVAESIVQQLSDPRTQTRDHRLWMVTVLLMVFTFWNVGLYWFCYVLIVWMTMGIIMALVQFGRDHQIIYRHFWPIFWKWSFFLSVLAYLLSLFSHQLPQV